MELRLAVLLIATIAVGLMAGVMSLYANTLMPGLRRLDARTFVAAFQAIDTRIINPLFLATFLGALLATGVSALLHSGADVREPLPWIVAAFIAYLVVVVLTIRVNVPLNDGIKAAGSVESIDDHGAVRAAFNEQRWVRANAVRTWLTLVAFGCLVWASMLAGRVGG